jgi:N-acetylglucosaminyldiphosphoundecaprenol N-acetyl-beta-D-mannosaminyltransferase
MSRVKVLNAVIDNVSMTELLETLTRGVVFTPNVDHLVKLQSDREFFEAYHSADFKTCDSKILFYVSRLLGVSLKEKISGSDLFPAFYRHHRKNPDIKIFLLGAREGVAAEAQRRINEQTGRDIIVDVHSPSFGFEQDEEECQRIIDIVNQSDANVLAVGVGAPKQEKFIYKYKSKFKNIKIFMAVGATLDFEAGNIKRAPKWVSEMGLEWLYRLISEPQRLWKRYLVEGPQFFWLAILQKLHLYTDPFGEIGPSPKSDAKYNPLRKLMHKLIIL